MQVHHHPQSGKTVEGVRLGSGACLAPGDFYNRTDGEWARILQGPMVGSRVEEECEVVWVRPHDLTQPAHRLLKLLAQRDSPEILWTGESWVVQGKRIQNPLWVRELCDFGLLADGKVAAAGRAYLQ